MTAERSTSLSLLERVKQRDPHAWDRLVYLYRPLVAYWCRRAGVREADVDDIAQEVFQAVSTSLGRFHRDRPGDSFRGWLRGVTRNKVLDLFRARSNQPEAAGGSSAQLRFQEMPDADLPELDEPHEQMSELYHRALELVRAEFEDRTWQAYWRGTVDGHAPADIAAELGVSAAAVRQAKSRILRRLKEEMGDLID
jgi:RNA polymerase sigma-70 factor (ECF subfamily)